jgi:MFS family permease
VGRRAAGTGTTARSTYELIAARACQGVGTAPGTLALIATNLAEVPARHKDSSIYCATTATGTSIGLILGGS